MPLDLTKVFLLYELEIQKPQWTFMTTKRKNDRRLGFLWIPITFGTLLVLYLLARIVHYLVS